MLASALDESSLNDDLNKGTAVWKFLVVVDNTPEFQTALRFASLRAARVGGGVAVLYIIPPADFQHWAAVELLMLEEARQEAELHLAQLAETVQALAGIMPEIVIREGKLQDQILDHIREDEDIHVLVLGAAQGEGPGPLVSDFGGPLLRNLRVPLVIVPGGLTDAEIDRLA
jgi:nucleotide-binding universal stress UspA family protein